MVTMHCMTGEFFCPGHHSVVSILHGRIEGRSVHRVRQLLAKSHDDILRVTAEYIVTSSGLGGQELGKAIGKLLVLGLLGRVGVDASRRASGPRAATVSGYYGFGA